ncbi:hypothetical protein ACJX0J_042134, partial [Zea mays]
CLVGILLVKLFSAEQDKFFLYNVFYYHTTVQQAIHIPIPKTRITNSTDMKRRNRILANMRQPEGFSEIYDDIRAHGVEASRLGQPLRDLEKEVTAKLERERSHCYTLEYRLFLATRKMEPGGQRIGATLAPLQALRNRNGFLVSETPQYSRYGNSNHVDFITKLSKVWNVASLASSQPALADDLHPILGKNQYTINLSIGLGRFNTNPLLLGCIGSVLHP